jgi:2-oxoglutarate ferredoxin oxidoreductase subunit delta
MEAFTKELDIVVPAEVSVDLSPQIAPVKINSAWCKACDICSALCPKCVLEPDRDGKPLIARPRECTQCGICWSHCPDLAITSNFK